MRREIRGLGHKGRTKEGGSQNIQTLIDSLFCVCFFFKQRWISATEKNCCALINASLKCIETE